MYSINLNRENVTSTLYNIELTKTLRQAQGDNKGMDNG